jgi:hypothetical protein
MVYAMFSIGILGFVVWSFWFYSPCELMALLYCKEKVINLAICWKSSVLLGTFYSKNLSSYTQSAGNRNHFYNSSSSETTREITYFNFKNFRDVYAKLKYTNLISDDWLAWFVGFTEGDGAILCYNGRPLFVLTQKERAVLDNIQKMLGFGTVKQYKSGSTVFHRYVVSDFTGILMLCHIFNGNLCLCHRITQLSQWIIDLNIKLSSPSSRIFGVTSLIVFINTPFLPTLKDAWLSGFTDAEGSFNVKIGKLNGIPSKVGLRFMLDQKNAEAFLRYIKTLFGAGNVTKRGSTDVYRYLCQAIVGIGSVIKYYRSFPLKTIKASSFDNWCEIYKIIINKEHLSPEGLKKVIEFKKKINVKNQEASKTGSSLK